MLVRLYFSVSSSVCGFSLALRSFHKRIFPYGSQGVDGMDGVGFDFTQKDVLDIHYVQILPVYELLERVYTQGILYDLRT